MIGAGLHYKVILVVGSLVSVNSSVKSSYAQKTPKQTKYNPHRDMGYFAYAACPAKSLAFRLSLSFRLSLVALKFLACPEITVTSS
jgi:hypothetical protein